MKRREESCPAGAGGGGLSVGGRSAKFRRRCLKDSAKQVFESIPQIPINVNEIKKIILKDQFINSDHSIDSTELLNVLVANSRGRNALFFKAHGHSDVFGLRSSIPEGSTQILDDENDKDGNSKSEESIMYVQLPDGYPVITSSEDEQHQGEGTSGSKAVDPLATVLDPLNMESEVIIIDANETKETRTRRSNYSERPKRLTAAKKAASTASSAGTPAPTPGPSSSKTKAKAESSRPSTQRTLTRKSSNTNEIEIPYSPSLADLQSKGKNGKEILSSIPGFNMRKVKLNKPNSSNRKLSCAQMIQQTKEGSLNLESPESILGQVNLRVLLNKGTFSRLPAVYQFKLQQLLPETDRLYDETRGLRLSCSAFNNEFFAKACHEWRERLLKGDFTPEAVQKSKNELDSDRRKFDSWKRKHFEPVWGVKKNYRLFQNFDDYAFGDIDIEPELHQANLAQPAKKLKASDEPLESVADEPERQHAASSDEVSVVKVDDDDDDDDIIVLDEADADKEVIVCENDEVQEKGSDKSDVVPTPDNGESEKAGVSLVVGDNESVQEKDSERETVQSSEREVLEIDFAKTSAEDSNGVNSSVTEISRSAEHEPVGELSVKDLIDSEKELCLESEVMKNGSPQDSDQHISKDAEDSSAKNAAKVHDAVEMGNDSKDSEPDIVNGSGSFDWKKSENRTSSDDKVSDVSDLNTSSSKTETPLADLDSPVHSKDKLDDPEEVNIAESSPIAEEKTERALSKEREGSGSLEILDKLTSESGQDAAEDADTQEVNREFEREVQTEMQTCDVTSEEESQADQDSVPVSPPGEEESQEEEQDKDELPDKEVEEVPEKDDGELSEKDEDKLAEKDEDGLAEKEEEQVGHVQPDIDLDVPSGDEEEAIDQKEVFADADNNSEATDTESVEHEINKAEEVDEAMEIDQESRLELENTTEESSNDKDTSYDVSTNISPLVNDDAGENSDSQQPIFEEESHAAVKTSDSSEDKFTFNASVANIDANQTSTNMMNVDEVGETLSEEGSTEQAVPETDTDTKDDHLSNDNKLFDSSQVQYGDETEKAEMQMASHSDDNMLNEQDTLNSETRDESSEGDESLKDQNSEESNDSSESVDEEKGEFSSNERSAPEQECLNDTTNLEKDDDDSEVNESEQEVCNSLQGMEDLSQENEYQNVDSPAVAQDASEASEEIAEIKLDAQSAGEMPVTEISDVYGDKGIGDNSEILGNQEELVINAENLVEINDEDFETNILSAANVDTNGDGLSVSIMSNSSLLSEGLKGSELTVGFDFSSNDPASELNLEKGTNLSKQDTNTTVDVSGVRTVDSSENNETSDVDNNLMRSKNLDDGTSALHSLEPNTDVAIGGQIIMRTETASDMQASGLVTLNLRADEPSLTPGSGLTIGSTPVPQHSGSSSTSLVEDKWRISRAAASPSPGPVAASRPASVGVLQTTTNPYEVVPPPINRPASADVVRFGTRGAVAATTAALSSSNAAVRRPGSADTAAAEAATAVKVKLRPASADTIQRDFGPTLLVHRPSSANAVPDLGFGDPDAPLSSALDDQKPGKAKAKQPNKGNKMMLKSYGAPLLPKTPAVSKNFTNYVCNTKAFLMCQSCGAFCHDECLNQQRLCISCVIK